MKTLTALLILLILSCAKYEPIIQEKETPQDKREYVFTDTTDYGDYIYIRYETIEINPPEITVTYGVYTIGIEAYYISRWQVVDTIPKTSFVETYRMNSEQDTAYLHYNYKYDRLRFNNKIYK